MKALIRLAAMMVAVSLMTGCLIVEDTGTTGSSVGTPVTTPPDFTVADANPVVPPTGGDNTTLPTPPEPTLIEEGFIINNGAVKTNSDHLDLQLVTLNRNLMKITANANCAGGTWEPWQSDVSIPVPATNAMITMSVQYQDWDRRITRCYRQSILQDRKGPDILFSKYPLASLEEGSTADISVNVTDEAGTVSSVTCGLNGLLKPCLAGINSVSITQLPVGDYEFSVQAQDDLGNESSKSVKWSVVSTTRRLSQGLRINNYKKVDILIIIDNSGSMQYEQQSMAQRTSKLLSVISGLDYQIAVTTTDPRDIALGDGRFIPISGANGQTIIDTSTPISVAQQRLSATLQRPETGSGDEQAIRATYRVIERYNANDSKARAFFREGAQFAALVISDEDESANTTKNDPQSLLGLITSSFGGQKMFGFHSIITKPGDTACRSTYGYSYGERYFSLSKLTGGVVGSVCESDYSTQITGIAQGIRDLLKTMTLQCAPLVEKGITVSLNGVTVTSSFRVDGVNLKFDSELAPGDYNVTYSCLK